MNGASAANCIIIHKDEAARQAIERHLSSRNFHLISTQAELSALPLGVLEQMEHEPTLLALDAAALEDPIGILRRLRAASHASFLVMVFPSSVPEIDELLARLVGPPAAKHLHVVSKTEKPESGEEAVQSDDASDDAIESEHFR